MRAKNTWVFILLAISILTANILSARADPPDERVKAKLEEIRKQGHPVSIDDLEKWYTYPPPDENIAEQLLDVFKKWPNVGKHDSNSPLPLVGNGRLPELNQPLDQATLQAIRKYLHQYREPLGALHELAAKKRGRYPIMLVDKFRERFSPSTTLSKEEREKIVYLQPVQHIRSSTRVLLLEAIARADEGINTGATRSILTALNLSRTLDDEPFMIAALYRKNCDDMTIDILQRIMSRTELSQNQLVKISGALEESEKSYALTSMLIGERCLNYFEVENASDKQLFLTFDFPQPLPPPDRTAKGRADDMLTLLDYKSDLIQASKFPFPESLQLARQIGRLTIDLSSKHTGARFHRDADVIKIGDNEPRKYTSNIFPAFARSSACVRAAAVAIAIERYRIAKRMIPESLESLVPEFLKAIPADPFDGKPLRYKKLAMGYVVYSIGEDGTDDGGKEQPISYDPQNKPAWDVTFTVLR